MNKNRLEAFSDGVVFVSYILSFVYLGIYWKGSIERALSPPRGQ